MKTTIFNYQRCFFLLFFLVLLFPLTASVFPPDITNYYPITKPSPDGYRIKTVVLDAGHGGRDNGCSGHKSKEKHLALSMVLKLGKAIEDYFPSINVIYTRKTDVFIPLYKRAAIANEHNADLFISIHCNALSKKASHIRGSETYVMGLHTAEHNLEVARRENEAILLEADYKKNYQGFDPNSDEGHIFLSMVQNVFLDKSIQFAEKVEAKFKNRAKRRSRGVKQAGFVVLKETTMPSVLIETGYLTNANEEAFLSTENGQNKMANAIFEAFIDYKLEVEDQSVEPTVALAQRQIPQTVVSSNKSSSSTTSNYTPPTKNTEAKAIPTSLIISKNEEVVKEKPIANIPSPVKQPIVEEEIKETKEVIFKIQLAASPVEIETSTRKWSKVPYVEIRKEKNLYKYLTGNDYSYEEAVKLRNEILKKGFNGAFIVAYKDGKRISLKEAKQQ